MLASVDISGMATRPAEGHVRDIDGLPPAVGVLLMVLITLVLLATLGTFLVV